MKKLWHVRTGSTHSAVRKDEILPFATTWVNLKNIMVSEISQTGKEPYDFTHMWDIKLKLVDTDSNVVVVRRMGVVQWGVQRA